MSPLNRTHFTYIACNRYETSDFGADDMEDIWKFMEMHVKPFSTRRKSANANTTPALYVRAAAMARLALASSAGAVPEAAHEWH